MSEHAPKHRNTCHPENKHLQQKSEIVDGLSGDLMHTHMYIYIYTQDAKIYAKQVYMFFLNKT